LLLAKAGASGGDSWSDEQIAAFAKAVKDVPSDRIVAALKAFGEADLRSDPLSPLPLELALATTALAKEAPATAAAPSAPAQQPARPAPPPRQPSMERRVVARDEAPRAEPSSNGEAPAAAANPAKKAAEPLPSSADLEDIRARWQEIYQRARELDFQTGALLNSGCGIIEATGDEIVFGFRVALMLDKMQEGGGKNVRALQQAVDDVLGPGRTVRCVPDANVNVQRPSRGGHLVRAAEELVSNDD
jgi:hypothetical protein